MPSVIRYVKAVADLPLKGKVGTAFRSYGWSKVATIDISKFPEDYGIYVIKINLGIKRQHSSNGID